MGSVAQRDLGPILRSVVRVITVSDAPDYEQPWQTEGPSQSTGSGAIIETAHGLRVLTNAHCVENHVFVEVHRHGTARKFVADVVALGHECDLALLRVDDASFYEGTTPLPIGDLPELGDRVQVCGYPIGGESLSVTEGLVSRIESVHYAQSQRRLLAIQIDAAINSGNSGGPAILDGMLIGVAFQALVGADRIGHSIASPVVQHFLKDVEDGIYDGFPALGVSVQRLESRAHRRYLGLPESEMGGVLVTQVTFGGSAWGVLREGDVLLTVDGIPIASDGTVPLRAGDLVGFDFVISKRQVREHLPLTVFRSGELMQVVVELEEPKYLVVEDRYDVPPSYYIYGGLLFVPLTRDYLKTWGPSWWSDAPHDLLSLYHNGIRTQDCIEPVVLQKVLADQINQGFHHLASLIVERCQGVRVRDLQHLVELIEGTDSDFVRIDAAYGTQIVLERHQVAAHSQRIFDRFGVPADRSPDLLDEADEEDEEP